uniref:protein prune homolog 2-like isoform X2 n=1 Tax=Myxine glutinosa TaxID=7769 RepID=UPI00358FE4BC
MKRKCHLVVTESAAGGGRHRMVVTMAGMDTSEEWQDEDFPRLVSERLAMDGYLHEEEDSPEREQTGEQDVHSMDAHSTERHKRKLQAPDFSLSLDQSECSVLSDAETPDDLDFDVDDLDTPDEAESIDYAQSTELEWENDTPITENQLGGKHPEGSKEDREVDREGTDERLWRSVVIGEQEFRIDMVAIEPYRKVLSHGGYYGEGLNAIIVFAACFLPDSRQPNYSHIMENLFLYVISTLELLVAENYLIVYLNGATPHRRMPGVGWLKRCYQMIDRKLRKNLKVVLIVHPTWFIRTILALSRPFISSKFYSKIRLVHSLPSLAAILPLEQIQIPDCIWQSEERRFIKKKRRLDEELKEAAESRIQQEEAEEVNEREVRNTHSAH